MQPIIEHPKAKSRIKRPKPERLPTYRLFSPELSDLEFARAEADMPKPFVLPRSSRIIEVA